MRVNLLKGMLTMRLDEMPHRPVPKPRKGKKQKYKGVTIPSRKERAKITKKEYNKALQEHGSWCNECGGTPIEMHHIYFRSQGGRRGYRNLVPLCNKHHRKCHTERAYADYWREQRKGKYGEHFYKDRFDLWKEGLIPNATEEAFDKFMEGEERD